MRNLAISVSVHGISQNGNHFQNINIEESWYHSLLTALLTKEIAERTGLLKAFDEPSLFSLSLVIDDTRQGILILAQGSESGYETFKRIRQICPDLKAVVTTGFLEHPDREKIMALGVSHYLPKPLSLINLALAIREEIQN